MARMRVYQLILFGRCTPQKLLLQRHSLHAEWCRTSPINQKHPSAARHAAVPETACLQAWSTMQRRHEKASISQASASALVGPPSKRLSRPQEHALRSAWQICLVTHSLYSIL